MRGRLFTLVSCLLLSISSVDAAHAASLTEQRRLYDQAKAALAKGNSAPYMASRSALRDYPLEPYLAYDELTHRLKSASNGSSKGIGTVQRVASTATRLASNRAFLWRSASRRISAQLRRSPRSLMPAPFQPAAEQG